MESPKYQRVLLKLSGEALAGEAGTGLDFTMLNTVAEAIGDCVKAGAQVAVVVGAGNFWRGVKNGEGYIERTRAGTARHRRRGAERPGYSEGFGIL